MTDFAKFLGLLFVAGCGVKNYDPCEGAISGTACLWAGTGQQGFNVESPNANRLDSKLDFPSDVTFGPDGRGYITDWNNHMIRRVEKDDSLVTIMGTDYEGDGPPEMEDRLPLCNPAGALGTTVALNHPTEVKFGPDGLLYEAAWHNNKIRVLDPATDWVWSLAGNGYGFQGDGGPACQALFNQPKSIAFGTDGTLYTIDQRNVRIRAISTGTNPTINTIAGDGKVGNIGDGGPAMAAEFGFETGTTPRPSGGLVVDGRTMYIADSLNNRIRRINLDTGMIDCIAGNSAQPGYTGDGGLATAATLNFPDDIELGPDHRLYIADRYNFAIRAIDLTTGIIDTVAGGTQCSTKDGTCSDRGTALTISFDEPYGLGFDLTGNLYVADTNNHRIVKVYR